MNVQIVSTQTKPITTKSGQKMELRVVQGFCDDGSVFKTVLHRDHSDIRPGRYELVSEVYVNFDCELAARFSFRAQKAQQ